ncbi:hypothetical protein ACFV8W_21705, partial [Streptomyces sp. NPDC059786]
MTHDPSPVPDGRTVHGRDGPRTPAGQEPTPLTRLHPTELADAVWMASEHGWLTSPSAHDRPPDETADLARAPGQDPPGPAAEPTPWLPAPEDALPYAPLYKDVSTWFDVCFCFD